MTLRVTRPLAKAVVVFFALGILLPGAGVAAPITLWDLNSSVTVDPNSDDGMFNWRIDGVDHMVQQWFWYRIGPAGPETPVNRLGDLSTKLSDADFDPNFETLSLRYAGTDVQLDVVFTLNGSNPGNHRSDIAESITITNLTGSEMDLHFFQYCNLDLDGTAEDANAEITGGNTAVQRDETVWASETVITPRPSHVQVAFYDAILQSLKDANATTLNDNAGPIGPGDLSWAFQWDFTIGAGESVLVSKDKAIVPEPATVALIGVGAALLVIRRRKHK